MNRNLTKFLALALTAACLLTACGKKADTPVQTTSTVSTAETTPAPDTLTGSWYSESAETPYTLNFLADGKTLLVSIPEYFRYYEPIKDWTQENGEISFQVFSSNQSIYMFTEEGAKPYWRTFQLKLENGKLTGTYKNSGEPTEAVFEKTSDTPRDGSPLENLTVEQKQEDLDVVWDIISKHPDPSYKTPLSEIGKEKQRIQAALADMDDMQFKMECAHLLAMLYDGHTGAGLPDEDMERLAVLPVELTFIGDNYYITRASEESKELLQAQVTAINGVDMEEVVTRLSTIISHDNDVDLRARIGKISSARNFVQQLNYVGVINDTNKIPLTVKDKNGSREVTLETTPYVKEEWVSCYKETATSQVPDVNYAEAWELDDKTLYFQYNSCMEDEKLPMATVVTEIETALKEKKYPKIVVDLRNNGGGNSNVIVPLVDALAALQATQKLDLYVLTSGYTYSSGVQAVRSFKNRTTCTTVGTPTGSSSTFFGNVRGCILPNSAIRVGYATSNSAGEGREPIAPDIFIDHTIEQFVGGIDPEIDLILKK